MTTYDALVDQRMRLKAELEHVEAMIKCNLPPCAICGGPKKDEKDWCFDCFVQWYDCGQTDPQKIREIVLKNRKNGLDAFGAKAKP